MNVGNVESTHALVRTALVPVRSEPDVRSEMVSQEPLGAALALLEREGEWARARGEDGYEGWVNSGGLHFCDADVAGAWWDEVGGRPAVSLDAILEDAAGGPLVRLPWGARVALAGEYVVTPGGRRGRLAEGRLVGWDEAAERFPGDAAAVVRTAREWMGVAYLWGGRTRWGTDCSGYVQAVYRLHGFQLPRDSQQQEEYGEPIVFGSGHPEPRPGDLLFFRGRESEGISHVAFSLGGRAIIHAAQVNGYVREETLEASGLAGRVAAVRRLFLG